MILAKKIGVLHKPNKMYLEYVPDEIVQQAAIYLLEKFGGRAVAPAKEFTMPEMSSVSARTRARM